MSKNLNNCHKSQKIHTKIFFPSRNYINKSNWPKINSLKKIKIVCIYLKIPTFSHFHWEPNPKGSRGRRGLMDRVLSRRPSLGKNIDFGKNNWSNFANCA